MSGLENQGAPKSVSRRAFLKAVAAAGMAAATAAALRACLPEERTLAFTSWGQTDLAFAELSVSYARLRG